MIVRSRNWLLLVFLVIGLLHAAVLRAGDRLHSVVIENPRAYGYHVGDSIDQVLHIKYARDMELRLDGAPKVGNVTPWIKLVSMTLDETVSDKSNYTKITLHYQISGFEQGNSVIDTPAFTLTVEKGHEKLPVLVHPVPLHISRLSDDLTPNYSNIRLAAPIGPERKSTGLIEAIKWFAFALGILFVALGIYRHFYLQERWAETHPFSVAHKGLKRLTGTPDDELLAHRLLHTAFNQHFGRTLFESNLDQFFEQYPSFLKEELTIRKFFEGSRSLFFAAENVDSVESAVYPIDKLRSLADRCRHFERRNTA